MRAQYRNLTTTLLLFAASVVLPWSSTVRADPPGQVYFTAMVAPKQSLTGVNNQANSVYLNWDSVEGEFPPLQGFHIVVGVNEDLLVTLPDTPMSTTEIAALYEPPAEQGRRKSEVISALNRELGNIDASNFAAAIHAKLTGDPQQNALWRKFGARLDFNIARAMRRGYLDDSNAGNGVLTYKLIADVDASDGGPNANDILLGEIDVDTSQPNPHILPETDDLAQVRLSRCDGPEAGKDQGAVALSWSTPEQQVDEYRNALLIAGYDVYRQSTCTDTPPQVNIRAAADGAQLDGNGFPMIPGLSRVNDQLVVISGGRPEDNEQRYKGFNSPYAQFTESPDQVAAAGLKPGQTCGYYVVPRDITGNYGDTHMIPVTIPDYMPPPAPWVVETRTDVVDGLLDTHNNDELDITFDHVDVINYYKDHRRGRQYCNLDTAQQEKELRYVGSKESCDTAVQTRVKLDIVAYNVYRFAQPNDARRFRDSDGDGYGDLDERVDLGDSLTNIGTACNFNQTNGTYYRVDPEADNNVNPYTMPAAAPYLQQRDDGRWVVEFSDTFPAQNLSEETFWYRIQAVHADGSLSELTEPVRGLFHDTSKPLRDEIACTWGERRCPYRTSFQQTEIPLYLGEDLTADEAARWLRLSCDVNGEQQTRNLGFTTVTDQNGDAHRAAVLSDRACQDFVVGRCAGSFVNAGFYDSAGNLLGTEIALGGGTGLPTCPTPTIQLTQDNCRVPTLHSFIDRISAPRGAAKLECPPDPDNCIRIYREVAGKSYPLKTVCDGDFPVCFDGYLIHKNGQVETAQCTPPYATQIKLPAMGGEPVCLSISQVNKNNIGSVKQHLGCLDPAQVQPGPPQPLEFVFDSPNPNDGEISWRPPQQPILGTLVEYFRNEPGAPEPYKRSQFVAHAGETALHGAQTLKLAGLPAPIHGAEPEWEEEWCFRVRSIGPAPTGEEDAALSPWAGPKCRIRTGANEIPDYMPWPKIHRPTETTDQGQPALAAAYLGADGIPVVRIGDIDLPAGCFPPQQVCQKDPTKTACLDPLDDPIAFPSQCGELCDDVRDSVAGKLNFVAYRQEKDANGVAGEFYQVSPMVTAPYCRTIVFDLPISVLADPLIKPLQVPIFGAPWDAESMVFLDRYPHVTGAEYRYQFVYFDNNNEIIEFKTSAWFTATPP